MRLFIIICIICYITGYCILNKDNSKKEYSEHSNINKTLKLVAENWERTDVNQDGKINCIDAAVLFYQYYPDKSKVRIEVNRNPKTDMHHLFNCVFTDGVWEAIEPQAYANYYFNYLMGAFWGSQYDNKYNRDATSDYIKYVRQDERPEALVKK